MKFTYRAPEKSGTTGGFRVRAVSRAGMAEGDWNASLGTGWSGQISCSLVANGGQGHNEQQDWASSNVTRLTVDVKNGVGTAHGYAETHDLKVNRRKVQRGGSVSLEFDQSAITNGTAEGSSPATVEVYLNKAKGTYSINMQVESPIEGTAHTVMCMRSTCHDSDSPLPVANVCLRNGLMGTLSDPNQLSGSVSDAQGIGSTSQVWTTTWRLARRGSGE
jgi:hypothetical protein